MGRAQRSTVGPRDGVAGGRTGSALPPAAVLPAQAAATGWAPTTLDRLVRALDLRQVGPRRFEVTAAEPGWPSLPGAQLVAAAVVAAERSFHGYSVRHLSCAFGRTARADEPSVAAMAKVHVGPSAITGRVAFTQAGAVHCEVAVVLHPVGSTARGAAPRDVALTPPADACGGERFGAGIVPWELLGVPADGRAPARALTWSRAAAAPSDATIQRALLAYLSEPLPIASAAEARGAAPRRRPGLSATVLSHSITFDAAFDLGDWMLITVDGARADEGYVHALAEFRTSRAAVAALVSQAAAVWDASPGPARRGGAADSRPHLQLVRS